MVMDEKTTKTLQEMDTAAGEARTELGKLMIESEEVGKAVGAVAGWVKRNYRTAGYKRLCRILIDLAEEE